MSERRIEGVVVDGAYLAPNACSTCGKWLPPWKGGVPACDADLYCFASHAPIRQTEDNQT